MKPWLAQPLLVLLTLIISCSSVPPTVEEYQTYEILEKALLKAEMDDRVSYNVFLLAETFYPKVGLPPICMPVNYTLRCNESCSEHFNCSLDYETYFLWTEYNLDLPIGTLLLSYAWSGIVLRGFNWEGTCHFLDGIELELEAGCLENATETVVLQALRGMTAVLKSYAKFQRRPAFVGSDDTKGYAIHWNEHDRQDRVFHDGNTVLTAMIVVLNIFIYFLAIGMTRYSYDILYKNIKHRKNPGYPLFWSIVLLTLCWNIGPSWLVLADYGSQIKYSIYIMIPLELLVALFVKKKANFPVPCLSGIKHRKHEEEDFVYERMVGWRCCHSLLSHFVQVVAIWSILVTLTFLVYYLTAVIIAFYIYPVQTLVKVIFIKAVVVSAILNVALVFSVSRFKFDISWSACKHNLIAAVTLITVLLFLPIIGFLAFVIGGILFSPSNQQTGLQGILTILPSAFLVVAAWFTHGKLFPKGIDNPDAGEEIVSELEKGALEKHKADDTTHMLQGAREQTRAGELSNYNSVDSQDMQSPLTHRRPLASDGETIPLLHT